MNPRNPSFLTPHFRACIQVLLVIFGLFTTSVQAKESADDLEFRFYGILNTNLISHLGLPGSSLEAPTRAVPGSMLDKELRNQGAFVFTLRQSRLGFRAAYRADPRWRISARGEVDFLGLHESEGPGTTTQVPLRLRHAYFQVESENLRWIFGQTWSVVARRRPTTYGRTAMALFNTAGALTSRLPQIGVEWWMPLPASSPTTSAEGATPMEGRLRWQFAIARPQSADGESQFTRFDVVDPGLLSAFPYLQSRVSYLGPGIEVGLASHLGRERFQVVRGTETEAGYRYGELRYENQDVLTWLLGLDAHVEAPWIWFSTHLWAGENVNGLSAHHGVVLHRWDVDDVFSNAALAGQVRQVEVRRAVGGFGELGIRLFPNLSWVISTGIETGPASNADEGQLYQNVGAFSGLLWNPLDPVDVSIEYLHLESKYGPSIRYRDDPTYRPDQDLLFGAAPPSREWQGKNDTFSFNVRLRF